MAKNASFSARHTATLLLPLSLLAAPALAQEVKEDSVILQPDKVKDDAPVVAVQNHYHAGQRDDAAVLTACEQAGIAFVPFFPIGGGRDIDDVRLAKVAARHDVPVAQIGIAWLLASSPVTLAIPGTGDIAHLEANQAAADIVLTEEDLADLA